MPEFNSTEEFLIKGHEVYVCRIPDRARTPKPGDDIVLNGFPRRVKAVERFKNTFDGGLTDNVGIEV